ncbi:hypothetical protein AKO1_007411 [Acrasis kona]|uniref:Kinase n=1 Tax=Acrasis kona TaxID=1008807 RepID=A0AAW2YR16_9EUKA
MNSSQEARIKGTDVDPAKMKELIFQVAGHKTIRQDDERFLKFIYEDRYNGWWESYFYEEIAPTLPALESFMPKYLGCAHLTDGDATKKYLALEHITLDYKNPVVIDFKIGTQSYDYTANEAKIQKELAKFNKQEELGFRISGKRSFNKHTREYHYQIQEDLISTTPENFKDVMERYLFDGHKIRTKTGRLMIGRLQELLNWFENENDKYKFFGSTVLLIYDSDREDGEKWSVWFIDHAHVFIIRAPETRDNGVILGIKTIVKAIDEVCQEVEVQV